MSTRFVSVDRNTPFLLPPDLRDWVPEDDLVHFVLEAVNLVPVEQFQVNARGSGSAQYPPHMMLSLLIYCYANGIFSSRRIERATHRDIGVRYLTGNTHPDHDTIAKFRRDNHDAIACCFVRVLQLAQEMKLLKLGVVSIDGTKIPANASKRKSVRYDRAGELLEHLETEVTALMGKAEQADQNDEDAQRLPDELKDRAKLKAKLQAARAEIEARNRARVDAEQAAFEREKARYAQAKEAGELPDGAKAPQAPRKKLREADQSNLTDPDSRLMCKNKKSPYEQSYNPQLAVDGEGSQLIVGARVSNKAFDYYELVADVESIPSVLGRPITVLADGSYGSHDQAIQVEAHGIGVYVSVHSQPTPAHPRSLRPQSDTPPKKNDRAKHPYWQAMQAKMDTDAVKALYALRKQTVEPVFGIIKRAINFREFRLRGLAKVSCEWNLVALAYNLKRMHTLKRA